MRRACFDAPGPEGSACHRHVVEYAPDGILITDIDGRIIYTNRRMTQMLGHAPGDMAGLLLAGLIPDGGQQEELRQLLQTLIQSSAPDEEYALSTEFRHRDGATLPVDIRLNGLDTDVEPRITAFVRDMTEQRRQEYLVHAMATYDDLTGLPNRMQLPQLLSAARFVPGTEQVGGALLLLDLDHFRHVNESLGHEYGDLLLVALCARLVDHLPPGTALVRFSGDELVAVLGNADRARAARVAEDILAILEEPFFVNDWEYTQSVSLGITLFPGDGDDVSQLVRKADLALGRAKAMGRRTYRFYDGQVAEKVRRRHSLQARLRHALERHEFHLHYQPRVALASQRITGWEALLRWNCPHEGAISPAEFVPVAEESGLILAIGDWVLHQALEQCARWQALGLDSGTMAVNLSARQLRIPDLAQRIAAALDRSGVRPEQLELEITESVLMEDVAAAIHTLGEVNRMGVKLAVDDFGTGYSSLGYLRAFPLDRLKIDRSFVTLLGGDGQDEAITSTIIVLAHGLGLSVVAEGVETEDQLRYLESNHCDEIQGFLFSRPLPASECERLMREGLRLSHESTR